jgi:AI-2 transport protein TqsA
VCLPMIFAWILAQVLSPLVRLFNRWKIPTSIMLTVVLVLLMFVLYWIGMFISSNAASIAKELPGYQKKLVMVSIDLVDEISLRFSSVSAADVKSQVAQQLGLLTGQLMNVIRGLAGIITSLISDVVMVIIMLAFILSGQKYSSHKISRAFSRANAQRVETVSKSISSNISSYLIVQTGISLLTGFLVWVVCRIAGIPNPQTWGALAFFLNYIPTIGSILAGIPPILLALLQFYPRVWPAVGTGLAILVINQVLGSIVTPKLMGDKLDLSPVVILLSLLFWGWLWGIPGAFLSVIILTSLKIICEQITPLRPIAIFISSGKSLGGTPPPGEP